MSGIGHNSEAEIIRSINNYVDKLIKSEEKFEKLQEELDKNKEEEQEPILLELGSQLLKGRKPFEDDNGKLRDDKGFGSWITGNFPNLPEVLPDTHDRSAVIWAAEYPEDYLDIKDRYSRVRTIRGRHAKWKEEQKANKKDGTDDVVDEGGEANESKPSSGNSPSGQSGNTYLDETLDDVVESLTPRQANSVGDAERAILEFNSLSEEEKIERLGGRPDVVDQKELDERLEGDYNPLNSATAVLVSLNRLRIYGGKREIERNIMQVLSQSSRMKSYEAEALVLLGEVILENREELVSLYSNQTDLNKLN